MICINKFYHDTFQNNNFQDISLDIPKCNPHIPSSSVLWSQSWQTNISLHLVSKPSNGNFLRFVNIILLNFAPILMSFSIRTLWSSFFLFFQCWILPPYWGSIIWYLAGVMLSMKQKTDSLAYQEPRTVISKYVLLFLLGTYVFFSMYWFCIPPNLIKLKSKLSKML